MILRDSFFVFSWKYYANMKKLFFLCLLGISFIGCQTVDNPIVDLDEETSELIDGEVKVIPTHVAILEVEGMMCQKGCGSIIRGGLYDIGGVSEVEVNFSEESPISEIIVYYDINMVSTEDMIVAIQDLADNRYSAQIKKITQSSISSEGLRPSS